MYRFNGFTQERRILGRSCGGYQILRRALHVLNQRSRAAVKAGIDDLPLILIQMGTFQGDLPLF